MSTSLQRPARAAAGAIIVAALLFVMASSAVHAQRFQNVIGGGSCTEEGLGGAAQLANSGYIGCGSTFSTGSPCGAVHAFVFKCDATGALVWSNYYPIGLMDSATDVIECANGEFVVCGTVHPMGGMRDIFLLRLDSNGNVLNAVTYNAGGDEDAWDVLETTTGMAPATAAGDIVVAGSTNIGSGTGRDGLLLRLTAGLTPIWESQWGGVTSNDDYYHAATECTFGVPPGMAGDIVAVGGTNSSIPTLRGLNNGDILVVRVGGNTGVIGPAPQGAAAWGFDQPDEAWSVIELQAATTPGDIVVSGDSRSLVGVINDEGCVLQLQPDPTLPKRADILYGDMGIGAESGRCVKEDPFFPGPPGGGIIVTGNTIMGGGTLWNQNAYLERFMANSLAPFGVPFAYGEHLHDWAWSLGICTRTTVNETQGYVLVGTTHSPNLMPPGDMSQIYMVKTDNGMAPMSMCNESPIAFMTNPNIFISQTLNFPIALLPFTLPRKMITPSSQSSLTQLCFTPRTARGNDGGNDGVSGIDRTADAKTAGALRVAPNPAAAGTDLTIRFNLPTAARVTVDVADINGRRVHRAASDELAGDTRLHVPTAGWASGTYVVTVKHGAVRLSTRVVVAH